MLQENALVAVYADPQRAGEAVRELEKTGFNLSQLSLASIIAPGRGPAAAYYSDSTHFKCWGEPSSLWNSLRSVIKGWAFLSLPGIGPMLVSGPLAMWIVAALDNAAIFSNLSAFGATLYSIGIPKERVQYYEAALKDGKYLLIAHGPAREILRARRVLASIDGARFESTSPDVAEAAETPDSRQAGDGQRQGLEAPT
jgi:hypothetical protein